MIRKHPNKRIWPFAALFFLLFAAVFLPSCARYAPTTVITHRTLLDITLRARGQISSEFFYYIAIDDSGSATSDGPHEEFSGANRLKDWTYYIVLDNGRFYEHSITAESDRDLVPTRLFNESSMRFHTATVEGDTIHVILYLDQLITSNKDLKFNFVTSRIPAYETRVMITPVDYLSAPYLTINSASLNMPVHSYDNPAISSHTTSADGDEPGDIFDWTVEIYQR